MANSQHKYLLERGWSQQQIDEVIRKAHEWLRGAGYTPLTEQGHWNGIMGNTQSYHLPSREKDARGMTEAFVEMLKGGKILDASRVHKFSRPGQPDTMSKSDGNYFVIRGYMDGMIMGERSFDTQREAEFYGKQMLEYMKKQYPKAKKITVDIDSTVNHAPGPKIKTLASRPGAKDTMAVEDRFYFGKERFADDAKQIADTILKQLGGGRFVAMTGAKNLAYRSSPPGLSMSIGRGAKNGIKYFRVDYDRAMDTYTLIFMNNSGGTVKEIPFVHAGEMRRVFTSTTGFDTSL